MLFKKDVKFKNGTLEKYIATFKDKGFNSEEIMVYISAKWRDVFKDPQRPYFVKRIESNVFGVASRLSLYPMESLNDDELVATEYFLGLNSNKSFGDAKDPFYSMLLVERRFFNKWSAKLTHASVGKFPKEKMPWVFTHNVLSTNIEYMVKAAVRSANHVGGFHMICIVLGHLNSFFLKYLNLNI